MNVISIDDQYNINGDKLLTKGKVYFSTNVRFKDSDNYYMIDDLGDGRWWPSHIFKTIQEKRQKILEELLDI